MLIPPNLIIIGAQKSGTTSLYKYLDCHPEIFMSKPVKETGFYLGETFSVKLMNRAGYSVTTKDDIYKNLMTKGYCGEKYLGDASTYYTFGEYSRIYNVPENMRLLSNNSQLKFIYILRNPLDRIVSHYLHAIKKEYTNSTLYEFIKINRKVITTSCYYYQLLPYTKKFGRENIKIILFEKMIENTMNTLNDIFQFLELKTINLDLQVISKAHNVSVIRSKILEERLNIHEYLSPEDKSIIIDDLNNLHNTFKEDFTNYWKIT